MSTFVGICGSQKPDVYFTYDALGNKIGKRVEYKNGSSSQNFYLRDAQGNTLAEVKDGTTEYHLYGSSRLGMLKNGTRQYDFTDHLGNVRAVVDEFGSVTAANDYLPFGRVAKRLKTEGYDPYP